MNSLNRWQTALGVSTAFSLGLLSTMPVLALPTDDVVKILQGVPVFTIADAQGAPLVAMEGNKKISGVFLSQREAQTFFDQLKKQKPDVAAKVSVQPVSLGEVYKIALSTANKPDALVFAYVPVPTEVEAAKKTRRATIPGRCASLYCQGRQRAGLSHHSAK